MKITFATICALIAIATATPAPAFPEIHEASAVEGGPILVARDTTDWINTALSSHNNARAQYGAKALTWNGDLSSGAASWAKGCQFQHSGGNYGENLWAATGTTDLTASLRNAVSSWMSEASKYDYNNPTFSSDTGHFTQVVWKGSTAVACEAAICGKGTIFPNDQSVYVVCRYSPPGNYLGQFAQNVGRHV